MTTNGKTFYQWAIGIIATALIFSVGMQVKGYSLRENVTINTIEIRNLKENINQINMDTRQINAKLDRLLERLQ